MNEIKAKLRKLFSYKRFCLTISAVLLITQLAAPRVQAQPTVLYTALGDSIAFGLSAIPLSNGYVPTYRRFVEVGTGLNVELIPLGVPGLTSSGLLAGINEIPAVRATIALSTIITMNIGGSDLLSARSAYKDGTCGGTDNQDCLRAAVDTFDDNFPAILDAIVSLRGSRATIFRTMDIYNPFVNVDMAQDSWPNDEGNDFQVINTYLDMFNTTIANEADPRNIPFARVHARFNGPNGDTDPNDMDPQLISFDGVHPNNDGHRVIAELLQDLGFRPFGCSAFGRKSFHRGLNRTT
jgi:lysophospholipase L1-like esterase